MNIPGFTAEARYTGQAGTVTQLGLSARPTVRFNQLSAAVTATGTASQIATMIPITVRSTASAFATEGLRVASTNSNLKLVGSSEA